MNIEEKETVEIYDPLHNEEIWYCQIDVTLQLFYLLFMNNWLNALTSKENMLQSISSVSNSENNQEMFKYRSER